MTELKQIKVEIANATLQDLKRRVASARIAEDFDNDDWSYGVNGAYLREISHYWANDFDWAAQETKINRYDHFKTEIDSVPIHFLMKKGKGPTPKPLILSHGWPWTFWDFQYVIDPLSDPAAYGGDAADAFDVIVPSLPGFGLSTPLRKSGINFWKTADLWQKLMTETLGYKRYAAHGGDWGAMVTSQLAHKYADSLIGVHVSAPMRLDAFSRARPYDLLGDYIGDLPPDIAAHAIKIERNLASHVAVHMLDPQTLAYAMNDSPVGLLAWLLERRRAWSDCHGDVESRFSKDDLLTNATLYWATESFSTTVRYYTEAARQPWAPSHDRQPVFQAPSGISIFRGDGAGLFADATVPLYNAHFVKAHESGGHFAAAEEPEAVIDDIRATFRPLR